MTEDNRDFTTDDLPDGLRRLLEAFEESMPEGDDEEVDAVNMPIEDLAGITIALCDPSPMNRAALAIEITTFIVSKMDNLPEEEAREHAADIVFRHLEGFLSKAICEENPEEGDCQ